VRALVVDGNGLRLEEADAPRPQPAEARIHTACSLISPGTELHYIARCTATGERLRLGYCAAGWVEEVGAGAGELEVGDRVVAMGWGYATHAEVVCVPHRLCVKVPDGLAFEEAVFAGIATTALHAVHRGTLDAESEAVIVGGGLVGQLVAQIAALHARRVYLADLVGARALCAAGGIRPLVLDGATELREAVERAAGRGKIDRIFLCMSGGASDVMAQAIGVLSAPRDVERRTAIVCVGRFEAHVAFSVDMGNLDIRYAARCGAGYRDAEHVLGRKDRVPLPGEASVDANLATCCALLRDGRIDAKAIPVVHVPFAEAPSAYDLLRRSPAHVTALFHYSSPSR
jgi:NADPH2:quinone reductase